MLDGNHTQGDYPGLIYEALSGQKTLSKIIWTDTENPISCKEKTVYDNRQRHSGIL